MKCFIHIFLMMMLCCSTFCLAQSNSNLGFFIKNEINGNDYISGIGTEIWTVNEVNNFGFAVNSSIGTARSTDKFNYQHSYFAWDLGIKFGYYSDFFVYGEVGFDLGELILSGRNDSDYDDYEDEHELNLGELISVVLINDYYDNYDSSNDIDGYIGAGIGLQNQQFAIEVFARYRQVDGDYWQADNQVYSGLKLTLNF